MGLFPTFQLCNELIQEWGALLGLCVCAKGKGNGLCLQRVCVKGGGVSVSSVCISLCLKKGLQTELCGFEIFRSSSELSLLCLTVCPAPPHAPPPAACRDHKRALELSQHSEEMGLILGICAGGLVVLILLLGVIIIIIKKG